MGSRLNIVPHNLHELTVSGREYLFHIPSSSLFECDDLSRHILKAIKQSKGIDEEHLLTELSNTFPVDDIRPALEELKSLAVVTSDSQVSFYDGSDSKPIAMEKLPLTTIVLNVNTGCNLSCTYCYKEDLDTPANNKRMTLETAKKSIEMLLQQSPDQPRYNIVFFGGEPLANFPLIKEVVMYAKQRFATDHKAVDFSLTTNGTLLDEKTIAFFQQHNVGIAVSIDGPKAYHDRNRITVGGKGTYETVAKKVALLFESYNARPVGARVTLTRGITDIVGIWDHLFNTVGFSEVGFAPVTSGEIESHNLSAEDLQEVFNNMKVLGERYRLAALNNQNIGFSNLHQLLTDLYEGTKKVLPCGAGVGMVAVDHAGSVNLCHRFTGSEEHVFGDVNTGIDKPSLNGFINQRLEQTREGGCASCRIRNLCAGGCYHESHARYQDATRPTYHYCEFMRDWVDFAIGVYTDIMNNNPDFFESHLAPRRAKS